MTLSLSSCFRVSVRPLFFLFVSLKFLLVLKSFNGVSRQFKECLKFNGVSRLFQGSFMGVTRVFKGCLNRCFKDVSRVFQGSFKSVSWKFKGNSMGV